MIKSYKDLEVYQKSYQAALRLHKTSLEFPRHELYELGSQMRRAATSVPLNIAEGYGRKISAKEFKYFLRIALGSCNEVSVLLQMIKDLGYLEKELFQELYETYDHLGRQLFRLIEKWKDSNIVHRTSNFDKG